MPLHLQGIRFLYIPTEGVFCGKERTYYFSVDVFKLTPYYSFFTCFIICMIRHYKQYSGLKKKKMVGERTHLKIHCYILLPSIILQLHISQRKTFLSLSNYFNSASLMCETAAARRQMLCFMPYHFSLSKKQMRNFVIPTGLFQICILCVGFF